MAKRLLKPNNYAFIDSQNLYLGVKDQGWELDFARFRVYLRDKYHVEKAFLLIGYLQGNEALYTEFQKAGYIVIFKPTLAIKKGHRVVVKGNVDAELVLHAMIEYRHYDQAVIVTGDGDFHCLVEYLVNHGKLLVLMVPNRRGFSALLRTFMDHVMFLDTQRKKVQKQVWKRKERH